MVEKEIKVEDLRKEAEALGIQLPKLSVGGVSNKDPKKVEAAKVHQKEQEIHLLQHSIAKKKADAKLKPIEKRRALLVARFKAVKSESRAVTYTNANVKAWIEEFKMINTSPKEWNKITKNGKVPYVPANKKKRTAKEVLDGMDLE